MITLSFNYNGNKYSALILEKFLEDRKEYRVTIMNGDLEKLLFGNNILIERAGKILCPNPPRPENETLVKQIIQSLMNWLGFRSPNDRYN